MTHISEIGDGQRDPATPAQKPSACARGPAGADRLGGVGFGSSSKSFFMLTSR